MIIRDLSTRDFVCYSYLDEYMCYIHFVNVKRLKRLKIGQKTFSGYSWKILSKTLRPPFSFFYFFFFFLVFFFPPSVYSIKVPQTRIKSFKRIWLRAKQRPIRTHRIPSIFIPHERLGPLPNSVSASRWFHCRWLVMQSFIVVNEMGYFT